MFVISQSLAIKNKKTGETKEYPSYFQSLFCPGVVCSVMDIKEAKTFETRKEAAAALKTLPKKYKIETISE